MLLEWLKIHPNIADTVNSFIIYQANKHQIWTKLTKHQTQGKFQQLLFSTLTNLNQWIYQSCENGFHLAEQIHSLHLEAEFYLFLPCGYAIKLKQSSFLIFLSASFVRLALCCPLVADMPAFCKVSDRLSVWEKILPRESVRNSSSVYQGTRYQDFPSIAMRGLSAQKYKYNNKSSSSCSPSTFLSTELFHHLLFQK